MSGGYAGQVPKRSLLRVRRAERLKREIALLSGMDDQLWRKIVLCGSAAVLGLALLILTAAWKFQYFGFSEASVFAMAVIVAALFWWLGRYVLWLPALLAMLMFAVIFETADVPDLTGNDKPDRKAERRAKVARALDKRRALLARLEAAP
jgi:hypothetical protein